MKFHEIVGRDPADGYEHGVFRKHGAPRLEHGRTELLCGKQLQHIGAMGERGKSFRGRRHTRRTGEVGCLRGLHNRWIAVRHEDEPPPARATSSTCLGVMTVPAPIRQSPARSAEREAMLSRACGEFRGTSMMLKPAAFKARPTGTASAGVRPRKIAINGIRVK